MRALKTVRLSARRVLAPAALSALVLRLRRPETRALQKADGGRQVACRHPLSGEVLAADVLANAGLWACPRSAAVAGAAPHEHYASTRRCTQHNMTF